MDPDRFGQLDGLLQSALQLPPAQRELFLRELSASDPRAGVVEGSIASLGSQYVVGLRARNSNTGDVLADEQVQAARKEDVLGALSQIAVRFRTRIGESLATIEKHSVPLEEATTPSLEAWRGRAYSEPTPIRRSQSSRKRGKNTPDCRSGSKPRLSLACDVEELRPAAAPAWLVPAVSGGDPTTDCL